MFRLSRFFGIVSGVAFVIFGIALGAFFNKLAIADLTGIEGEKHTLLAEEIRELAWSRISSSPVDAWPSGPQLQSDWFRKVVVALLEGTSVVGLQLSDSKGHTLFSVDPDGSNSSIKRITDSRVAIRGKVVNRLTEHNSHGASQERYLVSSYIPIQFDYPAPEAKGVLRIHSDVTPQLQQIKRTQKNIIIGVLLILSALFAILFAAVRLADRIIHAQITARQRAEAALREAHDNLESLVETRTRDLKAELARRQKAEEALHQAQKMEAIGQLTGGIAHDFNNLLTVIQGNSELLTTTQFGNEPKLQAILQAAGRGAELTQRLLAFSRRQPLRPAPFDLGELVNGMLVILKRTLQENIAVETRIAPDLGTAMADPGQVENTLLNLAINARDSMLDGGKLILACDNVKLTEDHVKYDAEIKAGPYVALSVSDNGSGMTGDVLEHAFEPFFTTKGSGCGSGLGLSMIYGFAKQTGGHTDISTEFGKGTTVNVYLPRVEVALNPPRSEVGNSIPRGDGQVILLVEDDPAVRALVEGMLVTLNYQVVSVANAVSAQAVITRADNIDLLLSDIVLPGGLSGTDLAKWVRELDSQIKIVLMSGYPAETATGDRLLPRKDILLNKPFRRHQLAETLHSALRELPSNVVALSVSG